MNALEINGIVVASPVDGAWDDGSISSSESGRDGGGTMQNDIITNKKSLPYSWGYLTAAETSTLLKAVKMNGFGNINIRIHNPEENRMETYNCYAGNRHVPIGILIGEEIFYNGISITFIEN